MNSLQHLRAADPILGRHIDSVGPFTLKVDEASDLYEALAQSIVYQQLNGKAAATIFGRVAALGKNGFPTPRELLALDDKRLRGAGLSQAKMLAVKDLALHQHKGLLPSIDEARARADDALIDQLTAVRGIGPWSVHMLLIFRLGREDVMPATDYGVRQGFQKVFRTKALPSPKQIEQRAERWRPYRSIASWYLWRALDAK